LKTYQKIKKNKIILKEIEKEKIWADKTVILTNIYYIYLLAILKP
jgi:hypothetical protein